MNYIQLKNDRICMCTSKALIEKWRD
ncbi:Protein of unknown function [Bacillus cereus]|nr:Protein of unknown function [Bacillus cereus]